MARAGLEPEYSDDSDLDRILEEDIDDLRRACAPPTINAPGVGGGGGGGGDYISENFDDDDDDFEDFELLRSIQQRYGVDVADHDIKPLATLPPPISDDDDDDYEFFRAIKERFSEKSSGDATKTTEDSCRDNPVSDDVDTAFGRESEDEYRDDLERELYDTSEKEDAFSSASSFPFAAQTFIEAIKKNRSCQKFLRNKLLHIEAKMEQIKALRKRLKTLRDFQVQCKKTIGRALSQKQDARVQLISVHKTRANAKVSSTGTESNVSSICYGPNENSYVACYKAALEKFPLSFHRDKWSKEDRQNLEKGIVRQYQEKLLHRSAHVLSSAQQPGLTNGVDAMMLSVKNHNITPETIQCFAGEVNWDQLASIYLPRRSGEECETRWLNHENSLINLGNWTREEEIKLLSLIEKNGFHSWKSVAEKLATNRTPYECLVHYQRSLNASILKREWIEDEDDQLRSAVESFGESNWQAVASVLEGRTGPQCSNRWKKTLHPARKRVGKWSDDEDKRLRIAVTLFCKSWHRIAQFVPGRTQVQCRERWVNVLDPSINQCEWTREEDKKLKKAIAEHGYCWSKVAGCVPFRTDNQCLRRWARLCPHDVPRLKAARTMQRIALISNFVDREEERPTLGPKDFVSINEENGNGTQKRKRKRPRKCKEKQPTEKLSSTNMENGNGTQERKRKRPRKCKETQPTEKLSSTNEENGNGTHERKRKRPSCSLKRKKHKKSARSLDNKMIGDSDADESNYEDTVCVKTSKAGLKKCNAKKCKTRSKNKSRENKETNQNCAAESWDIPIRLMSRRAKGRGVRSKGGSKDVSGNLYKASGINDDADLSFLELNEVQHDELTYSGSHVNINDGKDVESSDLDNMASHMSSSKMQSQPVSLTLPEDNNCIATELGMADDDTRTHQTGTASSIKTKAKKKHSKSKVDTDQLEDWDDLPLSALFKKGATRTH